MYVLQCANSSLLNAPTKGTNTYPTLRTADKWQPVNSSIIRRASPSTFSEVERLAHQANSNRYASWLRNTSTLRHQREDYGIQPGPLNAEPVHHAKDTLIICPNHQHIQHAPVLAIARVQLSTLITPILCYRAQCQRYISRSLALSSLITQPVRRRSIICVCTRA